MTVEEVGTRQDERVLLILETDLTCTSIVGIFHDRCGFRPLLHGCIIRTGNAGVDLLDNRHSLDALLTLRHNLLHNPGNMCVHVREFFLPS